LAGWQYGTVKQKMQDFSTRECGVQAHDQDLLGLNRTVLGWVANGWGLWVGGCFFWFGWDVAESAVFVGYIGVGAEVVICPITGEFQ
jgi:hypothetical protein